MLNPTDQVRQGTRSALFEKSSKLLKAVRVVAGSLPSEGASNWKDLMSAGTWYAGNAVRDGEDYSGWIVGHFMNADVRQSEGVEIKWGIHASGEERADWQGDESRTTVLLLVKGRFRVDLSVDSFVLEQEGDYAMWGPGIGHSWRAEEDSVVVTVRWPSAPLRGVSNGA